MRAVNLTDDEYNNYLNSYLNLVSFNISDLVPIILVNSTVD
jgi:hypothetical protein